VFFDPHSKPESGLRRRVYEVIYQTDTRAGLAFDLLLLAAITLSLITVSLETVPRFDPEVHPEYDRLFSAIEWVLTILFTIEYGLRVWCVESRRRYVLSTLGIVDFVSIAPAYLGLIFGSAEALHMIRALRLLRIFRLFQLGVWLREGHAMIRALRASRVKIAVFLGAVGVIVLISGSLLYFIEHETNEDFDSIPRSVYWAIVTLTTVGYGDIAPHTTLGQGLAASLMLMGYGIIAVPTGIVTAEMTRVHEHEHPSQIRYCAECQEGETDPHARFCRFCGEPMQAIGRVSLPPE
jgi:voltage-gated potassium channel